jgi:hypothetical protein
LLAAGLLVVAGSSTALAHGGGFGVGGPGGWPISTDKAHPSMPSLPAKPSHAAKPSFSLPQHSTLGAGWLKGSICATPPTAGSTPSATATASPAVAGANKVDMKFAVANGFGLGGYWPGLPGYWSPGQISSLRQSLCTVDGLKTALDNQIAGREKALAGLTSWIAAAKVLPAADAAKLNAEISSLTADLQTLKTAVDSATTLADLQADMKTLQADCVVYRTVWTWVHLVVGAEYSSAAGPLFDTITAKITDEIATANGLGKDTTEAQTLLDAMKAAVASAESLTTPLSATLLALTPSQLADGSAMPVLTSARMTLFNAWKDLWTARMDAHKALKALADLLPKATPAPTATPTSTPT